MLLGRVVYLLLIKLVATVPISPTESSGTVIEKGRYEPGVHTINNANPYQGVTVTEGHGKYPVIFRWFKFTLKPPYSIAHDKLRLAIWDTSFWTFWLKFGHKGP